jgi:hypothetical protein
MYDLKSKIRVQSNSQGCSCSLSNETALDVTLSFCNEDNIFFLLIHCQLLVNFSYHSKYYMRQKNTKVKRNKVQSTRRTCCHLNFYHQAYFLGYFEFGKQA